MKAWLESTTKVVTLGVVVDGKTVYVPARVWEGATEHGVRCHAFVTRIAVADGDDTAEFDRDLAEQRAPSVAVDAIPARLVL